MIKKLFLSFLLVFSLARPSYATEQILFGGTDNGDLVSGFGSAEYCALAGSTIWGNAYLATTLIPAAGTLKNFRAKVDSSPTSGNTATFTILKGSSGSGVGGLAATSLAVTISDTETDDEDTTNTVSVAAGDLLAMRLVWTGSDATDHATWSVIFEPTTANEVVTLSGNRDDTNATNGYYLPAHAPYNDDPTEFDQQVPFPTNATIVAMYVETESQPGSGKSCTFTLTIDGTPTAATVTVADTSVTGNITGQTIDITPGQLIAIDYAESNNPLDNAFWFGIVYKPDNSGEFCAFASGDSTTAASSTEYCKINSGDHVWDATIADWQALGNAGGTTTYNLLNMYLAASASIGTGGATFDAWVHNYTDSTDNMNVQLTAGQSTGNASGSVSIDSGDELIWKYTSSSAAAILMHHGVTFEIPAAAAARRRVLRVN